MSFDKLGGLQGKNNKETVRKNKSESILSNLFETGRERERGKNLDLRRSSDILSTKPMVSERQPIQAIPGEISPAMKLHQRLESAGAYEKLDPRRRVILKTYLTTETPIPDLGKLPEVQLRSRSVLSGLAHSAMRDVFNELPETERAKYDNDPEVAFRTRSAQQTELKSEKIKEAHDERRNPETGKVEISEIQRQNVAAANQRRGQEIRDGIYKGKPVGRPRKSENVSSTPFDPFRKPERRNNP